MNGAVSKKRWLMEIGIGFMLGRVWIFSMNPFGLAYLCASVVYPGGRSLVFLSVLAGFVSQAKGLDFLHYIMMTGLLWFVQKIMKKVDGKEGSCLVVAAIGGILNVALALESVLSTRMTAGRYVKNVISKEYEVTTFVQDVNYKALTGLARATKSGETVSGDNFSFT